MYISKQYYRVDVRACLDIIVISDGYELGGELDRTKAADVHNNTVTTR